MLENLDLGSRFPRQILFAERRGQERVVRRIPLVRVYAVQDAHESISSSADDAVKAEASVGPLNLVRVARAHRRDEICVVDAAFEEADPAPELEPAHRELVPTKIEARQPIGAEIALIRKVVNRQDGGRSSDDGMRRIARVEIDRHQAGLPVVRVHDSRPPAGRARSAPRGVLEGRAGEHGEPAGIVGILRVVWTVQRVALVEFRALDEQRPRAVGHRGIEEPDVVCGTADGDRKAVHQGAGFDASIFRQHDGHVPPKPRQRGRERAEHVGETAALREGLRFGTDQQHGRLVFGHGDATIRA